LEEKVRREEVRAQNMKVFSKGILALKMSGLNTLFLRIT